MALEISTDGTDGNARKDSYEPRAEDSQSDSNEPEENTTASWYKVLSVYKTDENGKTVPVPGRGANDPRYSKTVNNIRLHIYLLFEEPSSSIWAKIMVIGMVLLIFISIFAFIIDTDKEAADSFWSVLGWDIIEWVCTGSFTIEYLCRLVVCNVGNAWWPFWICRPLNVLDVLAILPSFIELSVRAPGETVENPENSTAILKVVRLARVFRLFKLSKYSAGMRIMGEGLRRSVQALGMLLFFLLISVVLFASVLHFVEKETHCVQRNNHTQVCSADDSSCYCTVIKNGYQSITNAMWPTIVTMTTVGYGDVVPSTVLGMFISVIAMLAGILLVALPVAIVGSKFQEVYLEMEQEKKERWLASKSGSNFGSKSRENKDPKHAQMELARNATIQKLSQLDDLVNDVTELNIKLQLKLNETAEASSEFSAFGRKMIESMVNTVEGKKRGGLSPSSSSAKPLLSPGAIIDHKQN